MKPADTHANHTDASATHAAKQNSDIIGKETIIGKKTVDNIATPEHKLQLQAFCHVMVKSPHPVLKKVKDCYTKSMSMNFLCGPVNMISAVKWALYKPSDGLKDRLNRLIILLMMSKYGRQTSYCNDDWRWKACG